MRRRRLRAEHLQPRARQLVAHRQADEDGEPEDDNVVPFEPPRADRDRLAGLT